jgi:hypothetical protein
MLPVPIGAERVRLSGADTRISMFALAPVIKVAFSSRFGCGAICMYMWFFKKCHDHSYQIQQGGNPKGASNQKNNLPTHLLYPLSVRVFSPTAKLLRLNKKAGDSDPHHLSHKYVIYIIS